MKFRFAGYIPNSLENGEGTRDVIFFAGCSRNCPGCHNKELQNFNFGTDIEIDEIIEIVKKNKPLIDGVTISGGDPIFQYPALLELCKRLKKEGFNIWVYTGAEFEDIKQQYGTELFKYIDALVDGPFKQELIEPKLRYRGSNNQRIIHFKDSFIFFEFL
jgi:anaerobic ribonucleoside-triphosphate reductase activating protein